jgi:acyl carrier protein
VLEIENKIKSIIGTHLDILPNEISELSSLRQDLGADSLDAVSILIEIEETFNIEITDQEAFKIKSLSDIIELVKTKTSKSFSK